jgi:heme-degrading monooxygenase HmoA
MTFQPDKIEAFLTNFQQTKHLIRGFEGCQYLELLQDAQNPNVYCTYSHWDSEKSLEIYRNSKLFTEIWGFTKTLFADKPTAFSVHRVEIV